MHKLKTNDDIVPIVVRVGGPLYKALVEESDRTESSLNVVVIELVKKALSVLDERDWFSQMRQAHADDPTLMNKPARRFKTTEPIESFIVRLPAELHNQITEYRELDRASLNLALNDLLKMGHQVRQDERAEDQAHA